MRYFVVLAAFAALVTAGDTTVPILPVKIDGKASQSWQSFSGGGLAYVEKEVAKSKYSTSTEAVSVKVVEEGVLHGTFVEGATMGSYSLSIPGFPGNLFPIETIAIDPIRFEIEEALVDGAMTYAYKAVHVGAVTIEGLYNKSAITNGHWLGWFEDPEKREVALKLKTKSGTTVLTVTFSGGRPSAYRTDLSRRRHSLTLTFDSIKMSTRNGAAPCLSWVQAIVDGTNETRTIAVPHRDKSGAVQKTFTYQKALLKKFVFPRFEQNPHSPAPAEFELHFQAHGVSID